MNVALEKFKNKESGLEVTIYVDENNGMYYAKSVDVSYFTKHYEKKEDLYKILGDDGFQKTYSKKIMEALRQRRELEPDDTSEDMKIMSMAKQDVFNEYCQWNGLLGGYGYDLLNIIENIYDINLQQ